jgi:hypothetical protein
MYSEFLPDCECARVQIGYGISKLRCWCAGAASLDEDALCEAVQGDDNRKARHAEASDFESAADGAVRDSQEEDVQDVVGGCDLVSLSGL